MVAKKTTLNEVGEMLSYVVKHMATKEDLQEVRDELGGVKGHLANLQGQVNSVENQLREGRYDRRIGDLEEKVFGAAR